MARNEHGAAGGRRISTKTILLGILGAVLVLFGVLNTDEVSVDWILGSWQTPLIVVILLSGVLGFAIGWLVRGRRDDD
jgi:uncharacterized integral membrane protein